MRQSDVGEIRSPYLIGPDDDNTSEQIGVYLVLRVRTAGVWAWRHTRQPHFPHQTLDPFAIDIMACCFEKNYHFSAAIERMAGVFFVDQTTKEQIAFIDRPGL